MSDIFKSLNKINVNHLIEKKDDLTYLSWASAWALIKENCSDVSYEVLKSENNMPYFENDAGAIVYTKVTIDKVTHEMWLPVMDSSNKAMKRIAYEYQTKYGPKQVQAFTMFDINKTIMRCLVKNLAMFGLGLYIYNGEDLPSDDGTQASVVKLPDLKAYRVDFGKKFIGKMIHEIPTNELESSIIYFEDEANKSGKPLSGKAKIFVDLAIQYLNQGEN